MEQFKSLELIEIVNAIHEGKEIQTFHNGRLLSTLPKLSVHEIDLRILKNDLDKGIVFIIKPKTETIDYKVQFFNRKLLYGSDKLLTENTHKITIEFNGETPILDSIKLEKL